MHPQTPVQLQQADLECDCAIQVRPGDVLIVGSDGLWDNLSTKQILEEVRPDCTLLSPRPHTYSWVAPIMSEALCLSDLPAAHCSSQQGWHTMCLDTPPSPAEPCSQLGLVSLALRMCTLMTLSPLSCCDRHDRASLRRRTAQPASP